MFSLNPRCSLAVNYEEFVGQEFGLLSAISVTAHLFVHLHQLLLLPIFPFYPLPLPSLLTEWTSWDHPGLHRSFKSENLFHTMASQMLCPAMFYLNHLLVFFTFSSWEPFSVFSYCSLIYLFHLHKLEMYMKERWRGEKKNIVDFLNYWMWRTCKLIHIKYSYHIY